MTRGEGACLVCGKPIIYFDKAKKMKCIMCHKTFESYASCEDGHFVCDECHAKKGIDMVMEECKNSTSKNPIVLLQKLMEDPYIYMHGPEHHVLVGSALLAAYKNAGGELDLDAALEEMRNRGAQVPGGICGLWGTCGAAVSTGIFISLITGASPLSGKEWGLCNEMTSRSLGAIAKTGGPRCCKRDSYLSIIEAVRFTEEKLGVHMEIKEFSCTRSDRNNQCIQKACPFYKAGR